MANYLATDTDLTAVANAIRTKGGTSGQLTFPDGFISAVDAIPTESGGFNIFETIINFPASTFGNYTLPPGYEMKFSPQLVSIKNTWLENKKLILGGDLKVTMPTVPTNLNGLFWGLHGGLSNTPPKKLTLNFDTKNVTNLSSFFRSARNISEVIGEIDFTSATNVASFFFGAETPAIAATLVEIRFKENTLKVSITDWAALTALSTDSQVSIANSLNESVTGETIQGAVFKDRATIIGSSVLSQDQTYHVFVADPSGEMSLADFITNVKGWTIT